MAIQVHRFYCARCDRFQYAETVAELATAVNYHATAYHPSDFSNWTETNIPSSVHYSPPPSPVMSQYATLPATQSRRIPVMADITDADRAFLAAGHVKWD